jgi:hypothetical protein
MRLTAPDMALHCMCSPSQSQKCGFHRNAQIILQTVHSIGDVQPRITPKRLLLLISEAAFLIFLFFYFIFFSYFLFPFFSGWLVVLDAGHCLDTHASLRTAASLSETALPSPHGDQTS